MYNRNVCYTRTEPNKDTRHHQGPPKPTCCCLPKEDARQKGVRRSKESITKSHLRRWPNLNLACLIAWIEGSCTHHSIRDADISQRHGLSPASGLESQHNRVIAEHSMYIPTLEQDCRHVADRPNPRIAPLPYWEPQDPRKRCPVSTGVPQNLLRRAHSTFASTRMKIHLTPRLGDLPRRRTPVEKAGTGSQSVARATGLTGTGTRRTGRTVTAEAGKTPHQALPGRSSGTSGKRISTTKRRTKPRASTRTSGLGESLLRLLCTLLA